MLRLDAAVRQYRRMQRLSARAVASARGAWRLLDQHALDVTTPRYLARMLPILLASQQAAATSASAYVDGALREQGLDLAPLGELAPMSLVGFASDGRPLESLLVAPVRRVKQLSADGVPVPQAMRSGRASLERIVATQVADAGRVATGVEIAARPRVGYVRLLNPPSCARCIVLVDRVYRWNAGFQRHPRCDCIHVPTRVAGDPEEMREYAEFVNAKSARSYFDELSTAEQDRIFGRAGAQAIRDGANLGQVVNARRGMYATTTGPYSRREVLATHMGTTGRSLAGRRLIESGARTQGQWGEFATRHTRAGTELRQVRRERVAIPRLMPEQIYREASSRDDAIRLLRRFGYIT